MGLRYLLEDPTSVPHTSYLSNVDTQVLFVISAVANHQAQLVPVARLVQLHLLPQGERGKQRKKVQKNLSKDSRCAGSSRSPALTHGSASPELSF